MCPEQGEDIAGCCFYGLVNKFPVKSAEVLKLQKRVSKELKRKVNEPETRAEIGMLWLCSGFPAPSL